MTASVLLGLFAGLGCVGVAAGLRTAPPSLAAIAGSMRRSPDVAPRPAERRWTARLGRGTAGWLTDRGVLSDRRTAALGPCLEVTGESVDELAARILVAGGAGLLVPPVLWTVAAFAGIAVPLAVPAVATVVLVPLGVVLPVVGLVRRAHDRRRHFRIVIGTFVDLVVLSLAGGVGIEGALFAASEVSSDWAARRLARAFHSARDSGRSPWAALARLGEDLGVPELSELSATVQLAGTEGARVRRALRARAVSLRRHEQADAESAANAMTERLFVPGALLLVGFLVFVGYPAFSRILGGF